MTKGDRGLYRCVADNQVRPPDEYLVAVNVFHKPDCYAVQDTVGQAADRQFDAKLVCRVSGRIYELCHKKTCFFAYVKNKGADQLHGNWEADQHL